MQYEYYAFRKEQYRKDFDKIERAWEDIQAARKQKNTKTRKEAEKRTRDVANKLAKVEPHLSYIWCEARNFDAKNDIRDAWSQQLTASPIPSDFSFTPNSSDIDRLPALSFMLSVPFQLKKPYLSKDDCDFHLLDNPIRKDKVFKTPMLAATGWKGALRSAFWQLGYDKDNEQIIRLLGNSRDDETGQAGRLYFYPTFFNKIGLEIINPHKRETGVGKNPIAIECVPLDAKGQFLVLYVPFGRIEKSEVIEDLKRVVEGIEAMLTVYGFGAKTSSGFGVAEFNGTGELAIKFLYTPPRSSPPEKPEYPEELRQFLEQYPEEKFELKPQKWRETNSASKSQQKTYGEARNQHKTYQKAAAAYESKLLEWEEEANREPLLSRSATFSTFDDMKEKANEVAEFISTNK